MTPWDLFLVTDLLYFFLLFCHLFHLTLIEFFSNRSYFFDTLLLFFYPSKSDNFKIGNLWVLFSPGVDVGRCSWKKFIFSFRFNVKRCFLSIFESIDLYRIKILFHSLPQKMKSLKGKKISFSFWVIPHCWDELFIGRSVSVHFFQSFTEWGFNRRWRFLLSTANFPFLWNFVHLFNEILIIFLILFNDHIHF